VRAAASGEPRHAALRYDGQLRRARAAKMMLRVMSAAKSARRRDAMSDAPDALMRVKASDAMAMRRAMRVTRPLISRAAMRAASPPCLPDAQPPIVDAPSAAYDAMPPPDDASLCLYYFRCAMR